MYKEKKTSIFRKILVLSKKYSIKKKINKSLVSDCQYKFQFSKDNRLRNSPSPSGNARRLQSWPGSVWEVPVFSGSLLPTRNRPCHAPVTSAFRLSVWCPGVYDLWCGISTPYSLCLSHGLCHLQWICWSTCIGISKISQWINMMATILTLS